METRHHKHHRRSAPALATSPPALAASKSPAPALAIKRSDTAPVTLRGWLYKQGSDGLQLWKKRWFVLSEYCLFYYKGGWCLQSKPFKHRRLTVGCLQETIKTITITCITIYKQYFHPVNR